MYKSTFNLRSTPQEFEVIVNDISGAGSADSPTLIIPARIYFNALNETRNQKIAFEVLSIKAVLKGTEKFFYISDFTHLISAPVFDRYSQWISLAFPINARVLDQIEKYRKGDILFNLEFDIQVALYEGLPITSPSGELIEKHFLTSTTTARAHIQFQLQQSHWIKILPQLGYNDYKLIELPATSLIIPAEYNISLKEFEEAQKYFIQGDYDKVVSHCRAALDPFKTKLNSENFKEFIRSKSEFEWANKVLYATEEWLDKIIKATFAFTSKTHHAPSIGHFSRTEAEIVLMITTGIIAYMGKLRFGVE